PRIERPAGLDSGFRHEARAQPPAAGARRGGLLYVSALLRHAPRRRAYPHRGDRPPGPPLPQKSIPPKYFYDEEGCRLFEAICELPEYYLTRTETAILRGNIAEIAQFIGPESQLIEFGSGVQAKTRILIQALQTQLYVPIDIAIETLRASSSELARRFPFLNIVGIC